MVLNKVKLVILNAKNEAVYRLVNLDSKELATYRHLQGIIHGFDSVLSYIKEIEYKESRENNDE